MGVSEANASIPAAVGDLEDSTPYKLFVGQVPMNMTAEQLQPNFEPYGNIEEVTIIYDKNTHLSKGCGFVTYSTEDAARAAIDALSEKLVLNGKPLVVKFAEGLRQRMEHKLHIGNLPEAFADDETAVNQLFADHGEIRRLQLLRPPEGQPGTAHLRYSKRSEAVAAINALNGCTTLPGSTRPLLVKFAEARASDSPPPPPPGGGAPANSGSGGGGAVGSANGGGGGGGVAGVAGGGGGFGGAPAPYLQMGGVGYGGGAAGGNPYMQMGGGGMPPPGGYGGGYGGGGNGERTQGAGYKLFVGMIPYATGEQELQQLFLPFGPLMEVFMMREKDGRSKGCAFVRYYTKEAANAAVQTLNGSMALPGAARNLVVKYADASEPRVHRSGGGNAGGGGMRFAGDQQGMASHHLAPHLQSHLSHAAGQYPPSTSMAGDAQWMMQGGAGQRMMGGHAQSQAAQMQMMPGAQMVGMALMPTQMAMVGGHVGTPMMMAGPFGGAPMDASMGMMHPAMATPFPVPQQHTAQMQQYQPVYPEHAPPLISNQASGQAPGGGVWDGSQSAAAAGGFTHLGDSSAMDHYGSHRSDGGLAGGFSAVPHHACGGSCGGGGGGGSFGSVGMGGGMSGLERRMAGVSLSLDDPSPPGSSWDRLYVSNLPKSYTEVDVQRLFGPYGALTEVACHKRSDGQSKGCFFVSFATSMEGQQAARALNNCMIPGNTRPIGVKPSTSRRRDSNPRPQSGQGMNGGGGYLGDGAYAAGPPSAGGVQPLRPAVGGTCLDTPGTVPLVLEGGGELGGVVGDLSSMANVGAVGVADLPSN